VYLLDDNSFCVNVTDYKGWENRSLTHAILQNNYKISKILLDYGADVNAAHKDAPLLYWASFFGHLEIAKLLLDNNANVNLSLYRHKYRKYSDTPLSIAIEKQNENMAQLLRMYGGQLTETIQLEVIQLQKKNRCTKTIACCNYLSINSTPFICFCRAIFKHVQYI